MTSTKRVAGIGLMALSVAMAILSVVAVGASVQLTRQLSGGFDRTFGSVDSALATADDALGSVDSSLEEVRLRVDRTDQAIAEFSQMLVEQPALFEGLADWLEEGTERPGAVGDAIEKAQDGVREAKLGALHAITATLGLTTGTVDAGLGELQARVDRHRDRIAAQRAETRELREKLQRRMLVITVTSSLSLVWILFSQAVTFVLGLSLYRGENYFERWLAPAEGDAKPGRDRPAAGGSS